MAKLNHNNLRQQALARMAWRSHKDAELAILRRAAEQAPLYAAKRRLAEQDQQAAIRKAARDIMAMRRLARSN